MRKSLRTSVLLLLVAVIVTSAPLMGSAAPLASPAAVQQPQAPDKSMETALIAVKNIINIDDAVYTDFTYSSSFSNYETMEGLTWSFFWSDAKNSQIYAQVTGDGVLLSFRKSTADQRSFGFADISKDAANEIAGGFIKKAKPDSYEYYKEPSSVTVNINNSEYSLNYIAEVNGYPFDIAQVSITVNKFTGEVTSYFTTNIDPGKYNFGGASDIIDESAAVNAYVGKIGLSLEYKSYYDYENSVLTVFPVYLFNSSGDKFIDAVTGDVVSYVYDRGSDGMALSDAPMAEASMGAADVAGGSRAALSPAEISAIEKVGGFISNDQALQKLTDAADLADFDASAFHDQYISLSRDYMNKDRYYYDISFSRYGEQLAKDDDITGIYGRVDAQTGKVTMFSINYYGFQYSTVKTNYTEAQAEAKVNAFLTKIAPGESMGSRKDSAQTNDNGASYNFQYVRYENGVPFRDNGINVSFNSYTGKITNYSLNWYDNVVFPDISSILTPLQALDGFIGQNGSRKLYITTGDGNAALVYDLRSHDYVDPYTGKALDYTGSPWNDSTVTPEYGDVAGHWAEPTVKRLLDNGVFLWGGSFEPDKVMTEAEFLQYLMLIEPNYAPVVPLAYFAQRGITIEADADTPLSRQEAARIIVEYLGYGDLAKQSEWFVYPFNDKADDAYKGYITICYMLGIIGGNNGSFNAAGNTTRAQAAVMLSNIILAKSAAAQ